MKTGQIIDNRFYVEGVCNTSGGMGNVVFVKDQQAATRERLVLKYCKTLDPKLIKRFQREVRLLSEFSGNGRVAQIVAYNTNHSPPYYVMRFYPDGDLEAIRKVILA